MRKKLQLLLAATLLILYASCSTLVPGPAEVDPVEPPELDADRPERGELNNFPETEGDLLQNYLTEANYVELCESPCQPTPMH